MDRFQPGSSRSFTAPPPVKPIEPRSPPSLSVVIPYYRGEKVIAGAVESALAQTVQPDEIVICDDGSPDDLAGALGSLREQVKIVRQENGGVASAMNATTRAATCEYLVQLDQDDAFMPGRLEAISRILSDRPDIDIVATDALVEQEGVCITNIEAVNPFRRDNQRVAILGSCFFLWPAVRRSLLLEVGGYDESFEVMQDWECFVRLILNGGVVAYVHEPLYRWRLTPGSRSSHDRVANVDAQVRMTLKTLSDPRLDPSEREVAKALLDGRRRWLASAQARYAVETFSPDARKLSLQVMTGRGFDWRMRAKGAIGALSPRLARRFLERRSERNAPAVEALAQRGFRLPG